MHPLYQFFCSLILGCILVQNTFATISVRVFSKDEGLFETNITKPRFYIQNIGDEPISNFYCYYYFTTELNQPPILEDYYTPDASVILENLNNGNFRVRFNFIGASLNPGQVRPNLDGEVVGLHYSNWSTWDKTNDFSNNGLSTFTLNANIPVYSSSGSLIYGNTPTDIGNPTQPLPQIATGKHGFAVLSKEYTDIRDRVFIKGGDIGSGEYVEVGANAVVNGNAYSGGTMFLRSNATIKGDAVASGMVNKQNGVVVNGTVRSNAQLEIPQISANPVLYGTIDKTVNDDGSIDLLPGSYKDFHAISRSTITLHPGDYSFDKFILETDVSIILKVNSTKRINLNINSLLRFGDRTVMRFEDGIAYPYSVKIYSAQTDQVSIGNNCQIYGNIICPSSEVHVYTNTNVYGALYGKKVVIEPGSVVCKPPLLQDLWHSEWATSPPFDPSVLDFKAVVPDITATLTINTITPSGTIVTINGQSITNIVILTGNTTNIPILLSNLDQCGTTAYNIEVTRESNCQIFVNDDSPCLSGREDGNSWSTAYKNLQQAIDRAFVEGKEIWVAEGIYKPTTRKDVADPRSASFMMYSGIEIKGGFKGAETEDKPAGSPYQTILSGDMAGNDNSCSTWPPTGGDLVYIADNVYHVVTITGFEKSSAVHLERLIIEHGVANGAGANANGGGIYITGCNPTIELVGIRNNIASANGAGIYVGNSIKSIVNCLIQGNCSTIGNGAGLYLLKSGDLTIDATVFDRNTAYDTSSQHGGSAIYLSEMQIHIVNSVFTRNHSFSHNATIFNNGGNLQIINNTFAFNIAATGATGIKNSVGSTVEVLNSIFWNGNNKNEFDGSGFTVSYSCITNGYTGTNNISAYPNFNALSTPEGADGKFGTIDDGLQLCEGSPCINAGSSIKAPEVDILEFTRLAKSSIDLGAYTYLPPNEYMGFYNEQGYFQTTNNFQVVDNLKSKGELRTCNMNRMYRVFQCELPRDKYTDKKSDIIVTVVCLGATGAPLGNYTNVKLYRMGNTQKFRSLYANEAGFIGKSVVFTNNSSFCGEYARSYVIQAIAGGKLQVVLDKSQFR